MVLAPAAVLMCKFKTDVIRCTFCIIPFGRGNSRSVPAGVVVDQIKRLVDKGYAEIVLTGVDMTSWGADLPATPKLGELVLRILDWCLTCQG